MHDSVAERRQGACRYARIAHFQYADSDESAEPGGSHTESCHSVRSDHPSVTFPLIPVLQAGSERRVRNGPAAEQSFSLVRIQPISTTCHRAPVSMAWRAGRRTEQRSPDSLPWWVASCGTRKFNSFPQMSDPLPTIFTGPSRNKLKDSVDRVTLLGRSLLDPGNQQSIDRSQLLARLITLSSRSTGHRATSLQADPNRELVPRATLRNAHRSQAVLTINPERSWLRLSTRCHVRGTALLSFGRRSA